MNDLDDTKNPKYTNRLLTEQGKWWKKILDVQIPYRYNIKKVCDGFVLDVGCGIGRNLLHLKGNGIGVDHNETSIKTAKSRGLKVFSISEFEESSYKKEEFFDSILLAHVLEHMDEKSGFEIISEYLPYLKKKGKVILITPQEAGYKSDQTHVSFIDFIKLEEIFKKNNIVLEKKYSFPFPRIIGRYFKYNEFVCVGIKE